MQHVTAFSRPQTVPPVPTTVPKRNVWILDSWRDLILYVGTPLLIIPLFTLAQARWNAQEIYLFVAAFGAMGHHLPGMIRAYGDRALFERFRWRFIIAPIFLLAVCVGFYFWDIKTNPVVMIVFLWGVWHGMMQTYGFGRIYDAKTGSFATLTRRLDFATCGIWFAAGVILSPARMTDTLEGFYGCGLPFISPAGIHALPQTLVFAYGSIGYLNSSIGIETITRVLTGVVAASGLLHFYYDGFIWKVREKSTRQSLGLAGGTADVNLGGFLPGWALHASKWAVAFVIPLAAMWFGKVYRAAPPADRSGYVAADLPTSARAHFNYGTALQQVGRLDEAETEYNAALRVDPNYVKVHVNLALVLMSKSKLDEAKKYYERAVQLDPSAGEVRSGYAYLLERLGRPDEARAEYENAIRLSPKSARLFYTYAAFLDKKGELDAAIAQYQRAVQVDPNLADAHSELATALFTKGDLPRAEAHYLEAARLDPKRADIHSNFGSLLLREGKPSQAFLL